MTTSINETEDIKALCEEFKSLNPKFVAIKARLEHIKKNIIKLADKKEVLSAGVSVKTSPRKGNIDYSLIKGIIKMTKDGTIEKYRKAGSDVTKIVIVG